MKEKKKLHKNVISFYMLLPHPLPSKPINLMLSTLEIKKKNTFSNGFSYRITLHFLNISFSVDLSVSNMAVEQETTQLDLGNLLATNSTDIDLKEFTEVFFVIKGDSNWKSNKMQTQRRIQSNVFFFFSCFFIFLFLFKTNIPVMCRPKIAINLRNGFLP